MRKIKFIFALLFSLLIFGCTKDNDDKKLPDLYNKSKTEIEEIFKDYTVTLDFKYEFNKEKIPNVFSKYGDEKITGDIVKDGDIITIYLYSSSIKLPDLTNKTVEEMKEIFNDLGVSSDLLAFAPDYYPSKKNTFVFYGNDLQIGQSYDFSKKLTIYYDNSTKLPDLTNKNKKEIEKILKDIEIENYEFDYVLDNDKEYDLFLGYKDFNAGDYIIPTETLKINLYKNDLKDKDLFISKYIDATFKGIEIYNPTDSSINLKNYYIAVFNNKSLTPTKTIELPDLSLEKNKTFVVGNKKHDLVDLNSENITFDTIDVIQLRYKNNNTFIDTIYDLGNILDNFKEEIFVRNPKIVKGNRNFTVSEWTGYVNTYLDVVGSFSTNEDFMPKFKLIEDKTFQEFGMTKVNVTGFADGDTIYANSLDSRDTTSYSGDDRLRFLMVNTPETEKPGQVGMKYAQVAKNFTKTMINNSSEVYYQSSKADGLRVSIDPSSDHRHLGLVWCNVTKDYEFSDIIYEDGSVAQISKGWHLLNFELIKYGLGTGNYVKNSSFTESPIIGNRYLYQWNEIAKNYATTNKLGIFSSIYKD